MSQWGRAEPDGVRILRETAEEHVTEDMFRNAYIDNAMDVLQYNPQAQFTAPHVFLQPGDLQSFLNVVSAWPAKAPPVHSRPLLSELVLAGQIRTDGVQHTFRSIMEFRTSQIRDWCMANRIDPDNPNESADERKRRLNREAVARHRALQRTDEGQHKDPQRAALEQGRREALDLLRRSRAYVKSEEARLRALVTSKKAEHAEALRMLEGKVEEWNMAIAQYKAQ